VRQIPVDRALPLFFDELEFTEAALAANPDTADLASIVAPKIAECDAMSRAERESRRAVVRASAVVAVKDSQLDSLTSRVAGIALVEANQNRESPLFRRLFPSAPYQIASQGLRKQAEFTQASLVPELRKQGEASPLKAVAEPLAAASQGALEALTARAKAMADRGIASHDLEEWKEGVNRLRLTLYAELLRRAAEKGYGRDWADTFFTRDSRGRATEDALPESPPPPAPTR